MRKIILILVAVFLSVTLVSSASLAQTKVIEIKALCFIPKNHAIASFLPTLIEKVNKACEGKVVWKLAGGPEVIQAKDQYNAVKTGVIDVSFLVSGYYPADVPGSYSAGLSTLTPWEERQSGYYNLLKDLHQEKNTYYLGRWHKFGFYVWTTFKMNNLKDLQGRKIRTSGTMGFPWVEGLGMIPVDIPAPEAHTGLQRGIVVGVTWPAIGICDLGWCDSLKYALDHEVFPFSNGLTLMNPDTWNKIPKDLQDKTMKAFAESEYDMVSHYNNIIDQERKKARDAGITFIKFTPDEARRVESVEKCWEFQKKIVSPELYQKLRESLKVR